MEQGCQHDFPSPGDGQLCQPRLSLHTFHCLHYSEPKNPNKRLANENIEGSSTDVGKSFQQRLSSPLAKTLQSQWCQGITQGQGRGNWIRVSVGDNGSKSLHTPVPLSPHWARSKGLRQRDSQLAGKMSHHADQTHARRPREKGGLNNTAWSLRKTATATAHHCHDHISTQPRAPRT